jgi:alkylhydroperoxidase family enzyme
VTWLPVETEAGSERDAVLGLVPEPYQAMRRVLIAAWQSTDPRVLDLCRCRLAQLMECRAELAGLDGDVLALLASWETSTELTERERAALAFAEQYHYDHRRLDTGLCAALQPMLSRRELVNFVWALHMNDAYIRGLSLLDIEPDPAGAALRVERTPPKMGGEVRTDDDCAEVMFLLDPGFHAAYSELNPVVVRQSLIDELTSETVRLLNASHQGCLY